MAGFGSRRRATEERERRFAIAYLKTEGNGVEAARLAGYRGTKASLAVTASRLLKRAKVRALLDAHAKKLERRLGMDVEEIIDRIGMQAQSNLGAFLRVVTPKQSTAVVKLIGKMEGVEEARQIAAALRGDGVVVDVEQGLKAGKSAFLKSYRVRQTPEGAPDISIEVRDPVPALALLAKIRGLTRDQPPPPPPRRVTVNLILKSLPLDVLERLHAQLEAAHAQQRAIPAEAQRV